MVTSRPRLTRRQLQVLHAVCRPGASNRLAAQELGISVSTLRHHLSAVYRSLGVASIGQAVYALGGLAEVPMGD